MKTHIGCPIKQKLSQNITLPTLLLFEMYLKKKYHINTIKLEKKLTFSKKFWNKMEGTCANIAKNAQNDKTPNDTLTLI